MTCFGKQVSSRNTIVRSQKIEIEETQEVSVIQPVSTSFLLRSLLFGSIHLLINTSKVLRTPQATFRRLYTYTRSYLSLLPLLAPTPFTPQSPALPVLPSSIFLPTPPFPYYQLLNEPSSVSVFSILMAPIRWTPSCCLTGVADDD